MTAGLEGAVKGPTNEGSDDEPTSDDREATSAGEEDATTPEAAGAHLLASDRYTVVLHVDDATLAGRAAETGRSELEDGTRVSAETSRRIACDADLVRVASRGGAREVSGKTRTVPPRLRRALEIRDRGCRFPGCGSRFTDAHHMRHWADGGPTRLDNLVLLCRTHHRLLHEDGFRLTADPDRRGRLIFYSPKGVPIPEVPPTVTLHDPACPKGAKLEGLTEARALAAAPRWEQDVPLALYLRAMASIA